MFFVFFEGDKNLNKYANLTREIGRRVSKKKEEKKKMLELEKNKEKEFVNSINFFLASSLLHNYNFMVVNQEQIFNFVCFSNESENSGA